MKKPQAYEATFRCVSVSRHRPGSNEPVAEHVGVTLDLADPTVKHGHRGAHLPLSPEQARTVAQMLIRHADLVERRAVPRSPAPVAPTVAAPAVEVAQDEACLTCGMPRSVSKEPEAHQWPSTAQANVCPSCGSVDRSFKRIRNRNVCRDVWHDSAPPLACRAEDRP